MKNKSIALIIVWLLCLTACSNAKTEAVQSDSGGEIGSQPVVGTPINAETGEEVSADEKTPALSLKEETIAKIIDGMTLSEKVGQMFICSFETGESGGALLELDKRTADTIKKYKIGGVIYFSANIDTAEQTLKLSEDLQSVSEIPLFIAVDEEGGRVSRITRSGKIDAVKMPPAKTIGNTGEPEKARETAATIAKELKELGINLNFAPCADLNSDNQGVIGDRAFSGNPETAGEFVQESIHGYTSNGIICAIKHFPGHGVAPGDTHNEEIVSEKSLAEILEADIIPFKMGSEAGVPMIMASHITVPEWGAPASMSAEATGYLRDVVGYNGIIITDSFCMGAVVNYYTPQEAAVNAIKSGVDIVLMPEDLGEAIEGVVSAVESGEIDVDKIDDSVRRILSLKFDYGLVTPNGPECSCE